MYKYLNIVSTRSSGGAKKGGMAKSFGGEIGAGKLFCRGLGFRLCGSCSVGRTYSVVSVPWEGGHKWWGTEWGFLPDEGLRSGTTSVTNIGVGSRGSGWSAGTPPRRACVDLGEQCAMRQKRRDGHSPPASGLKMAETSGEREGKKLEFAKTSLKIWCTEKIWAATSVQCTLPVLDATKFLSEAGAPSLAYSWWPWWMTCLPLVLVWDIELWWITWPYAIHLFQ